MKYRRDIPNEQRNNLLMFIFSIMFLLIAFTCTSQVRKTNFNHELNKETTLIFPNEGLMIDSIYLGALVDSIETNNYNVRLYAFLPENTILSDYKNIAIEFVDKSICIVEATRIETEERYIEYYIPNSVYNKIVTTKFKKIAFNNINKDFDKKDQNYFISFFNSFTVK